MKPPWKLFHRPSPALVAPPARPADTIIDPQHCFTGEPTNAERDLADICHHKDMRFILSYRYLRGEGLEIGALHFPLPVAPDVRVKYYDYCTREENLRKYPSLPADKIVVTDYVGDGEKLDLIPPGSLDFLIANHMLEHCQNVIGTLRVFYSKLRPEGVLFITLPDLRYTFDFRRPATSYEHLKRDHDEGPAGSLYDHYREIHTLGTGMSREEILRLNPGSPELLDEPALREKNAGTHIDCHFHAWTQSEIIEFFLRAGRDYGLDWEIEAISRNGIEVITVLRKTKVEVYDRNNPATRTSSP